MLLKGCCLGLVLLLATAYGQITGAEFPLGEKKDCHLVLKDPEGNATTPKDLGANETCVWRFQMAKDLTYFMVKTFSLLPGDYLLVYRNNTLGELVGNYSGVLDPFVTATFTKNTTMILHTGPKASKDFTRLVNLTYSTKACSMRVRSLGRVINSPLYTSPGKGIITCDYHIDLDIPKGKALTLSFSQFTLIKGSVTVYGGPDKTSKIIDMYTSQNATSVTDVILNGTSLTINMKFSLSVNVTQKIQAYTALTDAACSGKLTAPTVLHSPGYPGPYSNGLDCQWIITGPAKTTLLAQMKELNFGDNFDYVSVHDRGSRSGAALATYMRNSASPLASSSRNSLWVRFYSDNSQVGKGFTLNITLQGFGGSFMGTSGKIGWGLPKPPYTPPAANTGVEYYWIRVPQNQQVQLKITGAKIFPLTTITCYSGKTITGNMVAYFRTDLPFYTAFSDSNEMLVVAFGFNQTQYFRATYTSVNPGLFTNFYGSDGSVSLSAADVKNSTKAVFLVHPPLKLPTDSLLLSLKTLNLGKNETVTVYNGLSEHDVPLATFKGPTSYPNIMQAVQNHVSRGMRIDYWRNATNSSKSQLTDDNQKAILVASYTRTSTGCPLPRPGVITSPRYPLSYPINAACNTKVTVPKGKLLHLSFDTINFQPSHMLQVSSFDSGSKKTRFSLNGTQTSDDMIMNVGTLEFDFTAPIFKSGKEVGKGFNVTYEITDCGSLVELNMKTQSAVISTPNYPKKLKSQTTCVWIIQAPARGKQNTSVNIIQFQYELTGSHNNTPINGIYMYDGGSTLAQVRPVNMSAQKVPQFSVGNKFVLKYKFTPRNKSDVGFAFKMNLKIHECDKKDQCTNGKCLLPAWRCDGIDQCGDMTDEKDCTTVTDKYIGVPTWGFVLAIFAALAFGVVLAILVPCIYRRARNPNYRELRDLMVPVPT